jgi:hypothetical protein
MYEVEIFCRQVRSRSNEHRLAIQLLSEAGLSGQVIAVLRQELDSMIRVIYILAQPLESRTNLIKACVDGRKFSKATSKGAVSDREMVDLAQQLQGWTRSVYKFGCAFIHLSSLHDYNDRDPLRQLPPNAKDDLIQHCRHYHGGPNSADPDFHDLLPYLPRTFDKIANNLEYYLKCLENGDSLE